MFLKSLRVRIAGLFTILVIGGTILLFQVSYLSLRSLLMQEDQDDIRTVLLRYWSEYHTDGINRSTGSYITYQESIRGQDNLNGRDALICGRDPLPRRIGRDAGRHPDNSR